MRILLQNDTSKPLGFLMVSSSDHITPITGITPTVIISKNFSSFVTPAGAVSEVGNGWYKLVPAASDVDTLGTLILHASAAGADPVDIEYQVVAYDPYNANNLGLSYLDIPVSSVSGKVWDELRSEHNIAGTFGAVTEWAGDGTIIVTPLTGGIIRATTDGGVWKAFAYDKVFASWIVDQDLTGHQLYLIISDRAGRKVSQVNPGQISVTQQSPDEWLVTVNASDTLMPTPGQYRYFLRDNTVDLTVLFGSLFVETAPDIS